MRRFITIITGIGGHLLNGNRKMAYGFFLALLLWPVAFFLTQVSLLLLGFRQAADPIGAAGAARRDRPRPASRAGKVSMGTK